MCESLKNHKISNNVSKIYSKFSLLNLKPYFETSSRKEIPAADGTENESDLSAVGIVKYIISVMR